MNGIIMDRLLQLTVLLQMLGVEAGTLYFTARPLAGVVSVSTQDERDQYSQLPLPGVVQLRGVEAGAGGEQLYGAERGTQSVISKKFIYRYSLDTKSYTKFQLPTAYIPEDVAVDPLSGIVFYTESHYATINLITSDFQHTSQLITTDHNKPKALALHPAKGLIFWCGVTRNPGISRALMDGSEQQVIISQGIAYPSALHIDTQGDQLYWADSELAKVEVCDLMGSKCSQVIKASGHSFTGIALDATYIYLITQQSRYVFRLSIVNATGGKLEAVGDVGSVPNATYTPSSLTLYNPTSNYSQGESVCSVNNCSQICLPGRGRPTCRCLDGFQLHTNGSCTKLTFIPGLYYTDLHYHGVYQLDLAHNATKRNPVLDVNKPEGIAYSWKLKSIFWADSRNKHIFNLGACGTNNCFYNVKDTFPALPDATPSGLALDEATRRIYVVDKGRKIIYSMSYTGLDVELLVLKGLDIPHDIVLDVVIGKMYWSDSAGRIERADMADGSNREVFLADLGEPRGLALDLSVAEGVLYWADRLRRHLASFNLMTKAMRIIHQEDGVRFTGLAYGRGHLYASIEMADYILSINLTTLSVEIFGKGKVGDVHDLVYHDEEPPDINYTRKGLMRPGWTGGDGSVDMTESAGGVDKTLVISLGVVFGGLFLIVLVVMAGVIGYRSVTLRKHDASMYGMDDLPTDRTTRDEDDNYYEDLPSAEDGQSAPSPSIKPLGFLRPLPSIPSARQKELESRRGGLNVGALSRLREEAELPSDLDPFHRAMENERQKQRDMEQQEAKPDLLNL